jgi:NTE family protein
MVGKKVRAFLSSFIPPETRLEDTKIPFSLNAIDLITGKEVELTNGNLLDCIMASCAVPGFFPAVEIGSYRLIDGGTLDDVPVRLIKNKPIDLCLAIDVHQNDHGQISGNNITHNLHIPVSLPLFISDFYRAEMLMTSTLTQLNLAADPPDMLIRPDIPKDVSLFWGFQKAKEIITAGEEAMRKALPELISIITN